MPEFEDDLLTARLDRSTAPTPGEEAPAAFLTAVRRRRRARRVRQASIFVLGLLLLSPIAWLVRPQAIGPGYVNDDTPDPPSHAVPNHGPQNQTLLASTGATLLEVMAANRNRDPDAPVLPDVPLGRATRVLRVADTLDPEAALDQM